jgi:hypothetical protein
LLTCITYKQQARQHEKAGMKHHQGQLADWRAALCSAVQCSAATSHGAAPALRCRCCRPRPAWQTCNTQQQQAGLQEEEQRMKRQGCKVSDLPAVL